MAEGRIIKASAFTSDSISNLSDFQFRLWVGLITHADNVGRGDARPAILKGQIFPLRGKVRETDIEKALEALADNGSIFLYEVAGKPFYAFPKWFEHQRLRKETSKFPAPDDPAASCRKLPQVAASCGEMPPRREEKKKGRRREEEGEGEGEGEEKVGGGGVTRAREDENEPPNDLARVSSFYLDRINASPSPMCCEYLKSYTESLGADVVLHALNIALDERKPNWSYIQGILQRYERDGLKTLDAVMQAEADYIQRKQAQSPRGKERRVTTFMDV